VAEWKKFYQKKHPGEIKILTTGILVVFRGLKFESDTDIGEKDSFRSGTK